ncbi:anti-anti-sigma factor [Lentzea atacamensis]|uniref:Anti-sigma factor antagonist n=1 Tax=Lentzea atacamensis TaxID=531938 RepID=A0A316HNI9_9PSEU|nr:STAS domain-containing protein [Lentzea atacamensis]PWK82152.1 anti-anti-sigma factor [Lentzea atacamensis]
MNALFRSDETEPLTITTHTCQGFPVTAVHGEIDMCTEELFCVVLKRQLANKPSVLVVDLRGVTFLGSSGIHVLLAGHTDAQLIGTRFAVVANQRAVLMPLSVTGLDLVFDLHHDLHEALRVHAA